MSNPTGAVNVYTEWGELQEVIVGSILNQNEYSLDKSFFFYFAENVQDKIERAIIEKSFKVKEKFLRERQEDLDSLATLLQDLGIKVLRPDIPTEGGEFQTPHFREHLSPVDNPRDLTLIAGNEIIETPTGWKRRYFENDLLKRIFQQYFLQGSGWSVAPRPVLTENSYHYDFDFRTYQLGQKGEGNREYEILFDAAQCLKFGQDIVMNVANENHYKGYEWLSRHLDGKFKIHPITITDHHIDGMFMPLRPGLLLVNSTTMKSQIDKLPKELQKWDIVYSTTHKAKYAADNYLLASANISVNVLPLSEKKVLVFTENEGEIQPFAEDLEKRGIEVITMRFRHSRLFGGGLHCATLDTKRAGGVEKFL